VGQDPAIFLDRGRPLLNATPFASLIQKPEYTMLGRTYSIGYEPDLKETLLDRPQRTVLNPAWNWAVWYPLRRSGRFAQLPADEQRLLGAPRALRRARALRHRAGRARRSLHVPGRNAARTVGASGNGLSLASLAPWPRNTKSCARTAASSSRASCLPPTPRPRGTNARTAGCSSRSSAPSRRPSSVETSRRRRVSGAPGSRRARTPAPCCDRS